jgi:hypothetical protein
MLLGVGLLLGTLAAVSLYGGPASAQPQLAAAMPGRYQILTQPLRPMAGGGPTVQIVVLDTVTGRCWLTTDDLPNQWRDLGAPPRGGN